MKSITKIILGMLGIAGSGILTYYIVTKEDNTIVIAHPITNPEQDTIAEAQVVPEINIDGITTALGIDNEEFTLTEVDGLYINSTNDKMLIIKEDVWGKMILDIQAKFPYIVDDCSYYYDLPVLSEYEFVGLLTYLGYSRSAKRISAYSATEFKKGYGKSYAAGEICCNCGGEPLVGQQVDAVIIK